MFKIKEWSSFQSYKDRNPPWIRLHKKLIDNYDFQRMSVEARALLPMLWLMASEDKDPVSGMLRFSHEEIAFRLRQETKTIAKTINEIIDSGFIEKTDSYIEVTDSLQIYHSETETEAEAETEAKAETDPKAETTVAAAKKPPTADTWNAYALSYRNRYGVDPVRNAKVNGQLSNLLKRIPKDEAPDVAAYYVRSNNSFYALKGHPVDLLLSDAEKLRTEWVTQNQITQTKARQIDKTQTNYNVWDKLKEELNAE